MITTQTIRVILADDHQIFIEGLKTVLKHHENIDCEVIGTAQTGEALLNLMQVAKVDLLVLDLNLPDMDGLELLKSIRKANSDTKIIALTMYDEPKVVKAAFKCCVDGYILKRNGIDELYQSIEEVMQGQTFMGKGVMATRPAFGKKAMMIGSSNINYQDRFIKKHQLTKREMEVLQLITQALSNKEIAKELYISDQTVSVHRKNIMRKLGVSNTAGLIKVAYDNSLI